MYFTYIIRCKDDSLYTGYTTDIVRRIKEHESGINCKYSRVKGFKRLETYFIADSKSNAMKLEYYIKRLNRNKKKEHESGINCKYSRVKGFKRLETYFIADSKSNAMKLEYYIKRLNRNKKLWIIKNPKEFLETLENKECYKLPHNE